MGAAASLCFFTLLFMLSVGPRCVAQNPPATLLPSALAYDAAGNLYVADANRHQVLEATLAGTLLVVAGTGIQGSEGDGGPATDAELNSPEGLAIGPDGILYIADTGNARIRSIRGGIITAFAGSGTQGTTGDGGSAIAASLRSPTALAIDGTGALLICDTADHRIRRVAGGLIANFAGTGVQGFAGDGGAATQAEFDSPAGIAVAPDGRVLLADTHNQRIRAVAPNGFMSTFAGTGVRDFGGDGGLAVAAQLSTPRGLALLPDGSLLIADTGNQRVRRVAPSGTVVTLAGAGHEGASNDGDSAITAALRSPRAVAVSHFGMPVLADTLNGTVRVLVAGNVLNQPAALAAPRTSVIQPAMAPTVTYGSGTASLTVSGAVGIPQGTVNLNEGGSKIASGTLNGGVATVAMPSLDSGVHALTAVYGGDGLNPAATAVLAPLTVTPAPVVATANPATAVYGAPLPALSGTLTGVLPQDAGGVTALFSVAAGNPLAVGSYPITATLTGPRAGNYVLSSAGTLQITQAGSTITLGSLGQSFAGVPLQLTAQVAASTSGRPTGAVQFLDGATVVGTGTVINGSASAVYTAPPAGSLTLSARYLGDANFAGSSSAAQMAVITAMPDFGLSLGGASTATVTAGATATYSLIVSAQPTPFTGVVTLSASGLPAGASVLFSPVQVLPGTGAATVAVSVLTPVQALLLQPHRSGGGLLSFAGGIGVCLVLGRKRRGRSLIPLSVLLSTGLLLSGCGARTVSEGGNGPGPQTYTLAITGTSTNLLGAVVTHSTFATLTVGN